MSKIYELFLTLFLFFLVFPLEAAQANDPFGCAEELAAHDWSGDTPNFEEGALQKQTESLEDRILRVLTLLPERGEIQASLQKVSGGLTNANYKVQIGSNTYFARCGHANNSLLGASLEREWQCLSAASHTGLAPKPVFYSSDEAILITTFVDTGHRTVDLRDPVSQRKFCALIRCLHQSNADFAIDFCPFDSIRRYITNAKELGLALPDALFSQVLPWIDCLKKAGLPLSKRVPCHLDLHHANLLDDGERFWLIDWEYAGMGDPLFDLATAASVEDFSDDEMTALLHAYFNDRSPSEEELSHFYSMRILADVRWSLWCYLQSKLSPLDLPFSPFGELFLNNAINRLTNH